MANRLADGNQAKVEGLLDRLESRLEVLDNQFDKNKNNLINTAEVLIT